MTAPILKPGDVIHLAWPYVRSEGIEQPTARRNVQEAVDAYQEFGVKIRFTTVIDGLAAPQVVAVFRNEEN